jgi:hypothetical protein
MKRVLRLGGRLMIIDGYRDGPWGWFIYDVCVARVEGDVHHASAKCIRDLMTDAGLRPISQRVYRGPAPFFMTEAIVADSIPGFATPHLRVRNPMTAGKHVPGLRNPQTRAE